MHKSGIKASPWGSAKFWVTLCLVIGIGSLTIFPRILSLKSHWLSDEDLWLGRSGYFILALMNKDFDETIIAPHPGVTTMWLGGISLWLRYKGGLAAANLATKPFYSPETLAAARMSVALTTIVAIFIAWYFLFKLLGWWQSFLATVFIAIDPFYLALSRILHTDALATSFVLLAVLSLLVYLEGNQARSYVIFSGICFGLACLSKITAFMLVLYPPLLLGFYKIANVRRDQNEFNFSTLYLYSTWLGSAFLTSICLWPGLWTRFGGQSLLPFFGFVFLLLGITYWSYRHIQTSASKSISQPKHLIVGLLMVVILGASAWKVVQPIAYDGLNLATTPHIVSFLFFGKIVKDPGLLFYPLVISLRSLPLGLPLLFLGLVWFVCYDQYSKYKISRIFFALLMLLPIFVVPLSLAAKKMSRYVLPVFPFIEILVAIGFSILLKEFTNLKIYHSVKETMAYLRERPLSFCSGLSIFILVMCFQVVPAFTVHPDYIAYYNPIWKVADVPRLFAIGGEVGSDRAGLYLSQKPNAKQLLVRASPVAAKGMQYYFSGEIVRYNEEVPYYPDYEVVHLYDVQLKRADYDVNRQLEHVVRINGIDFVWIYGAPLDSTGTEGK